LQKVEKRLIGDLIATSKYLKGCHAEKRLLKFFHAVP
jgi:hypothetical protein